MNLEQIFEKIKLKKVKIDVAIERATFYGLYRKSTLSVDLRISVISQHRLVSCSLAFRRMNKICNLSKNNNFLVFF